MNMQLFNIPCLLLCFLLISACAGNADWSSNHLVSLAKEEIKWIAKGQDNWQVIKFQDIQYFDRNKTGRDDYFVGRVCGNVLIKNKATQQTELVEFISYTYSISCGFKICPSAVVRLIPESAASTLGFAQENWQSDRQHLQALCRIIPDGTSITLDQRKWIIKKSLPE